LKQLRAQCTAQRLPFSISDDWLFLEMRLLVDAGIVAAQASNTAEPLLMHCIATYGQEGLLIVRASWLRAQNASSLGRHDGWEGTLTIDDLREIHQQSGTAMLPLIALRDPWLSSSANETADTLATILIQALDAVTERKRRVADEHSVQRMEMLEQRRALEAASQGAKSGRRDAENQLSVAHAQLAAATLRCNETAELVAYAYCRVSNGLYTPIYAAHTAYTSAPSHVHTFSDSTPCFLQGKEEETTTNASDAAAANRHGD
jgi:hypothetical protein